MTLERLTTAILLSLALLLSQTAMSQGYRILSSYSFDDMTANDVTGNGHDGLLYGSPQFDDGIIGQALRLDGLDDYMEIPASVQFDVQTVSLSLWTKITNQPANQQILVEKMEGGVGYSLWSEAGSAALTFGIWGTGGEHAEVSAPFQLFPNVWTSVSVSYDRAELRLYVDGSLAASEILPSVSIVQGSSLLVGRGDQGMNFDGSLDQIVVAEGGITPENTCGEALKIWDPVSQQCIGTFLDMTDSLGIADPDHRHFGIAVVDANNDGWVDLYYPNGFGDPIVAPPPSGTCVDSSLILPPPVENYNVFYLNNGDGTFAPDIAPAAGVDDWWNAMRHAWGDYDNDGMRDLISHNFIQSNLYRAVSLSPLEYENVNAESGLEICITKGTGASWVDVNNDGWLDVYGCEYDPARNAADHVNLMFLNNGDGTFTDITVQAGLTLPDNPMGVTFADYDNDGDQDFFVTNSHIPPLGAPSRLYRNDGVDSLTGIPSFTDAGPEAGVDVVGEVGRGFSAAWGDYDNDGRLDLLFGREEDSRLFHNEGPNGQGIWTFTDVTDQGGLDFAALLFQDGNFGDIDNDGYLDILMANASGPNRVFLNNADGTWTEIADLVGMDLRSYNNQGALPADIDNDGDLDVAWYAHTLGEPNTLFLNQTRGNNWIQFRLTGTESNRDAVGARITIVAEIQPGSVVSQVREVMAGTGFFTDMPRIQSFGLGKAPEVTEVRIDWPSGQSQILGPLQINQRHDIVEPTITSAGDGDTGQIPGAFVLDQNYPNPFNPSTDITFRIPEAGRVTLKVYNLLGQEVATLVDELLQAGEFSVRFDADGLASGVYLYRLQTGNRGALFTSTKKMIMVR